MDGDGISVDLMSLRITNSQQIRDILTVSSHMQYLEHGKGVAID
jgi:hypothetical protein